MSEYKEQQTQYQPGFPWKATNLKNGHEYLVTGERRNCTNAQDGQLMIDYERNGEKYCLSADEFIEKFSCSEHLERISIKPALKQEPIAWASENVIPLRPGKNNHPCVLTDTRCEANTVPLYAGPDSVTEALAKQADEGIRLYAKRIKYDEFKCEIMPDCFANATLILDAPEQGGE